MREEGYSLLLLGCALIASVSYAGRALSHGRARYGRTDKQGGSVFLGQRLLEMGYWVLQPIGQACVAIGIRPNTITWLSLMFGVAGAAALAQGRFGLGAVLALASNLCDALDGMVARATGVSSDSGEVLDAVVD